MPAPNGTKETPSAASEGEADVHPAVRAAVRLCLSAKEYRIVHDVVANHAPAVQDKLPSSLRHDYTRDSRNRHSMAALRASLRVFAGSAIALKLSEMILSRVQGGAAMTTLGRIHQACSSLSYRIAIANIDHLHNSVRNPTLRSSALQSSVFQCPCPFCYFYRFLVRLRSNLRTDDAKPFRERNPRISHALTSRYAPAIGASLAGFALGVCPQDQLRLTTAIYTTTRSMEFLFNTMDLKGWLDRRPWWFGSWLLMPVSCAQLFHAFVFDRETTPKVRQHSSLQSVIAKALLVVWQCHTETFAELHS